MSSCQDKSCKSCRVFDALSDINEDGSLADDFDIGEALDVLGGVAAQITSTLDPQAFREWVGAVAVLRNEMAKQRENIDIKTCVPAGHA